MMQGGVHLNLIKHVTDRIFNLSIQGYFAYGHRMTVNIFKTFLKLPLSSLSILRTFLSSLRISRIICLQIKD